MVIENTILVIEDNPEMLENIVAILELAHYKVITAGDGRTGVDKAYKIKPDLVLCDVMMPELDGFGVLHLLSKYLDTSEIPFIFLTAKTDKSDLRKGMNLGADDYITKPFDGLELLNVIEMRLQKSQLIHNHFKNVSEGLDESAHQRKKNRDFHKLIDNRISRKYKRKDILYLEGQNPTEMFFIQSGKIKTYKSNYEGKELITGLHREGDFIGYVPLIENSEYREGAVALTDADLAVIQKQDFLSILYSNREIARKFIELLSNNLQEAEKRLIELAYQSVRQKVVGALLRIYNQYDLSHQKNPIISVSRKDISNLIGAATESLNRTLADFKDEGLIDLTEGGILIVNKVSLADILK